MKNEKDLKNYQIRTDLIIDEAIPTGIKGYKKSVYEENNIQVTEIILDSLEGLEVNKKPGKYITINFSDVTDKTNRKNLIDILANEIKKFLTYLNIKDKAAGLIIGLGNIKSTPDALGPKTVEQVLVTKYLFDLEGTIIEPGIRNISSFIPGVTGVTGIESSDVILGIKHYTKPDFIIAIDALASSSISRVNKTIQITDTGIHPGSGVLNTRKEISKETIGIPVIAIGIPTVVDAVTIVSDTIKYLIKQVSYNKHNFSSGKHKLTPLLNQNYIDHEESLTKKEKDELLGMLGSLADEEIKALIFEVLTPIGYNMMVTPKEVDFLIDNLSQVLASGLNKALHNKDMN
ncbi:MAG: GPR endopeptidase [Bacilli bacterium]